MDTPDALPPALSFRERARVRADRNREDLKAQFRPKQRVAPPAAPPASEPAPRTRQLTLAQGIVLHLPPPSPEAARAMRWYVRLAELQYLAALLALIPVLLGLLLVVGVVGLVLWLVLFG